MKRHFSFAVGVLALASMALYMSSCEDEDNQKQKGNWVEADADFPGTARGGAVCFQIGNYAFVGTGANTNKTEERERFRDFYMCTMDENDNIHWTAKYDKKDSADKATCKFTEAVCSMPDSSAARNGAVAFSLNIDGKDYGYVGLGYDGVNYLKDFWRYDVEENKWEKAPDYPGDSVRYAVAFVIDNIAYVGTGENFDNDVLSDFYSFDGKEWKTIQSIGRPRAQAAAFIMNVDGTTYGYVVGGQNGGTAIDWFQRYNPKTNTWEDLYRIADRTDYTFDDEYTLAAYGSVAFSLYPLPDETTYENACSRAFITTGGSKGTGNATWEYNPQYDYWIPRRNFEASVRKFCVSFVLTTKSGRQVPFITTGTTSDLTVSGSGGSFFSQTYYFNPYENYEAKD